MEMRPFLIAGGGIAGLAAGLGLAKTGRAAVIFEQASAFETVGAGLQISPNAVWALQWLGAWQAVEPHCVVPAEIHVRDGLNGGLLQRVRLGKHFEKRHGEPYRVAHRADLLGGLLAAARADSRIELINATQAVRAINLADGAALEFATGSRRAGAAVIAADGIRSKLRQAIAGQGDPLFRGHAIFRTLIPFDAVPPSVVADAVTLWLYPGGHVVHYAVSKWTQFNIVAATDSAWTATGWSETGRPDDVRLAFADAADPLADLLAIPKSWLKWAGADLAPVEQWSKGRIALAGDAAHASLPYLAQGATMALEDACVLAGSVKETPDIAAALSRYAALRRERTARVQNESLRLGRLYHARGPARLLRNLGLRAVTGERFLRRNDWIYRWKPE
jgi:3-hydroxybenzoate 6-monooxygenase